MKPLAFVCTENTILANQLANRLEDLGYQVQPIADATQLFAEAQSAKPFIIISDLVSPRADLLSIIRRLRQDDATQHIPVLGIAKDANEQSQAEAVEAGATLVAMENGLLAQLPQLLNQALAVE